MAKYTMITGASSGIGEEFARIFAKHGSSLILVARNKEAMEKLAEELRRQFNVLIEVLPADLSHPDECQRLFNQCEENNWVVSELVNNAGLGDNQSFIDSDWKKQEQMIRVNIESLVRLTHLFLPTIVKQTNGGVLNVASTAAFAPGPFMAVYYATKAFVLSFSVALKEELSNTPVRVSALCPGPTTSGFQKTAGMHNANLFKAMSVATSKDVAQYGYLAFKKGQTVAVYGLLNKVSVVLMGLSPRILVVKIVRRLQGM